MVLQIAVKRGGEGVNLNLSIFGWEGGLMSAENLRRSDFDDLNFI